MNKWLLDREKSQMTNTEESIFNLGNSKYSSRWTIKFPLYKYWQSIMASIQREQHTSGDFVGETWETWGRPGLKKNTCRETTHPVLFLQETPTSD